MADAAAPTRRPAWRAFVTGAGTGCAVHAALQPLDVVKTRMIAAGPEAGRGVAATLRGVLERDGAAGLYRGVVPSMWRVGLGAGVFFATVQTLVPGRDSGREAATRLMLAGAAGRLLGGAVQAPFTVVKTRVEAGAARAGTVSALRTIAAREGVRGLYAGFWPSYLRDAPHSALYFLFYTRIKAFLAARSGADIGSPAVQASAAFAGSALAVMLTQPPDVVRTLMQLDPRVTVAGACRSATRGRGPAGLFVGLAPRLAKKSLSTTAVWVLYEQVSPRLDALLVKIKAG